MVGFRLGVKIRDANPATHHNGRSEPPTQNREKRWEGPGLTGTNHSERVSSYLFISWQLA